MKEVHEFVELPKPLAQLSQSQRALVGARALKGYQKQPKALVRGVRELAAQAVGVSSQTIRDGIQVLNGIPELIEAVEREQITASTAARMACKPEEEQRAYLAKQSGARRRARRNVVIDPPANGEIRGIGVVLANEAIDRLKRIPKNDGLRFRAFEIVRDWIRKNQ